MANYVYPAVFQEAEEGGYLVNFPDIPGCFTEGDDLRDALKMAGEVLPLMLCTYEDKGMEIPVPSPIRSVKCGKDSFATYISCDTGSYRRSRNNRAVKKTLSIPAWLDEAATAAGINFSQTLQEALKAQLHVV